MLSPIKKTVGHTKSYKNTKLDEHSSLVFFFEYQNIIYNKGWVNHCWRNYERT